MKVLFLGSVFSKENEKEIIEHSKKAVEFSANVFQKKIIQGLKDSGVDYNVLSAPGIGSFPNAYKKPCFRGFKEKQQEFDYVSFNNIWGLRNFSRANSLKKAITQFIKQSGEKLIIVYSVHTPFLTAAAYAKRKDPSIKICLIVPDLPQYMNLSAKKSLVYKIGKKFDIEKFNKLNAYVDSYMLLTEQMKEMLPINGKPYTVVEGIVDERDLIKDTLGQEINIQEKYVVYTGKLNESFGLKNLVDAFMLINDQCLKLALCGVGDALPYIAEKANEDKRIILLGQISPSEAVAWQNRASVLVNPRENNEEYTRYSFPSKTIEYLTKSAPVVAYKLDGMKDIYKEFLVVPKDQTKEAFADAIESAIKSKRDNSRFIEYAREELTAIKVVQKLLLL